METSLIEQFWYPKYGPGQLWEIATDRAIERGAKLLKNHSVKNIVCKDGKITAVVCNTPEGEKTIEGDIFVSSMPVKDLVAGMTGDEPSKEIKYIAENLPYRDFVTVGLLVNKLNLKNETKMKTLNNIVPDCWIYVQETSVNSAEFRFSTTGRRIWWKTRKIQYGSDLNISAPRETISGI